MRHLDLLEGAPAKHRRDLSEDEARALDEAELASVSRLPGSTGWRIAAGRKVGVIRVGADLQVSVRPKVDIDHLVFMLGYAREPTFWRDRPVQLERHKDMAAVLADAFRRLAVRATERGLLQGYRVVEEALPVMRGRIRVNDQISRRMGIPLPLEVTYDEFSVDIPENQILLAATVRLLSFPGVPAPTRQALYRLRILLANVTLLPSAPRWNPSRLNARYEPALRLAEVILDDDSIEQVRGDKTVPLTGFVLNMWKVYEDFVCMALKHTLEDRRGGRAWPQFPSKFDAGRTIPMKPDLVWGRSPRQPEIVVDAKYKEEKSEKFPNADLYQMLAYCTVLRRRHGHLVYAKGEGEQRDFRVAESNVTVHCHTLDLKAEPDGLLEQVSGIADRMLAPHVSGSSGSIPSEPYRVRPIRS